MSIPFAQPFVDAAVELTDGQFSVGDIATTGDAALNVLSAVIDPLEWVIGGLVDWLWDVLMEYCAPFREALDFVLGNSEAVRQVAGDFQAWSQRIADSANQTIDAAQSVLAGWEGPGAASYYRAQKAHIDSLRGQSGIVALIADFVHVIGTIVALYKEIVTDLIKEGISWLIAKGIEMAAAAFPTLGASIAAFTGMASIKVAGMLGDLATYFKKLGDRTTTAGKMLGRIADAIKKAAECYAKVQEKAGIIAQTFTDTVAYAEDSPAAGNPASSIKEF